MTADILTATRGISTSTKGDRTTTQPVSLIPSTVGARCVCVVPKNNGIEGHLFGGGLVKKARKKDCMNETTEKSIPADKLVRVTFLPEGRTVEFEFGAMPYQHHGKPMSFLDVAENHDVFLDHACGGVCA